MVQSILTDKQIERQRNKFEEALKSVTQLKPDLSRHKVQTDWYANRHVQDRWLGWLMSAEHRARSSEKKERV